MDVYNRPFNQARYSTMKKAKQFKKELKELLNKYDATIGFSVGEGSDTHGLYDEQMEVDFYGVMPSGRFKTIIETSKLSDGWGVHKSDL